MRRAWAAISTGLILSLAACACGPSQLDCRGTLTEATGPTGSEAQYGDVTCVTQGLDKEETLGGQ